MKGKYVFFEREIADLRNLIQQRCNEPDKSKQKAIRNEMRKIGFYGRDDFGINDMTIDKFNDLIAEGRIIVLKGDLPMVLENTSAAQAKVKSQKSKSEGRKDSDEWYVLGLCDEILDSKGHRQHRFPFLRGDAGITLPVDIYYEELSLVIEYREMQHSKSVPLFDKKNTVSGVSRGEQRLIYDQRRRDVLPKHGIDLIEINYDELALGSNNRLSRNKEQDLLVLRNKLKKYIKRH